MFGQHSPVDPTVVIPSALNDALARIAELERLASAVPPDPNYNGTTSNADWSITIHQARLRNGMLYLRGNVERLGANVSASGTNIALGTLTFIPAGNVALIQGLTTQDTASIAIPGDLPCVSYQPQSRVLTLTRYPNINTGGTITFNGPVLHTALDP